MLHLSTTLAPGIPRRPGVLHLSTALASNAQPRSCAQTRNNLKEYAHPLAHSVKFAFWSSRPVKSTRTEPCIEQVLQMTYLSLPVAPEAWVTRPLRSIIGCVAKALRFQLASDGFTRLDS